MAADILGSLATSAAGPVIQTAGNVISQAMANDANLKLYREQRDYNEPIKQMQRLQAAGLNPQLVYGHGSIANVAGAPPRQEAARVGDFDFSNTLANTQQIRNMEEQREQIIAARKQAEAQTSGIELENLRKSIDLYATMDAAIKSGEPVKSSMPAPLMWLSNKLHEIVAGFGNTLSGVGDRISDYQQYRAQEYGKLSDSVKAWQREREAADPKNLR